MFYSFTMSNNTSAFMNITNGTQRAIPAIWVKSWTATYLLICFEGAAGNALIVFLILYNSKFRSGCGLLIAHCLIAYTVLCGLSFPLVTISTYVKQINSWQINQKYCKFPQFIQMTCKIAAVWLDAFIAINRLLALGFPYQYRELVKKKTEHIVLVFIWTLAGVICLFAWFDIGLVYVMLYSLGTCATVPRGHIGQLVAVVGFYAPAVAAGLIYVIIYVMAAKRKRTKVLNLMPAISGADNRTGEVASRVESKRMTTTNMMCVSYLTNSLFAQILPISIQFTMNAGNDLTHPLLIMWLAAAQLLGYALNPPVCFVINKDYRREVRRMIKNIALRWKSGKKTARITSADLQMTSVRDGQLTSS